MENIRWGRRIRAFRRLKRMNQVELAKEMNISVSILGQIEQGKRVPNEVQLKSISSVLDIQLDELKGEIKDAE
ncbi:XRE family transcriptional regulator [Psychrobacillus glaciei]|uniref:XRE family transcriptional regulator n=1 Tax=Psychrobacillus glaciei TaxID=2283160 RepID=A0A5J6SMJ1_9BACI|nr:helix-turn-helix transcriptional regulator [Psychrobacillus glaciei]QFF97417.1 XRE family transcriptional regulator [Psychrobacillus glaciei]